MKVEDTLYRIREVYDTHFCVRIDLDYEEVLYKVLDSTYKYVWILEHSEYMGSWTPSSNILFSHHSNPELVHVRNDIMEILMDTHSFYEIIKKEHIKHLSFVQTNIIPPFYLTAKKFVGKKRYDMFKECIDYLFELEVESDYICFVSSRKDVLENILEKLGIILNAMDQK